MEAIVKVDNVKKYFLGLLKKELKAVDGIGFEINKGEISAIKAYFSGQIKLLKI